MRTRETVKLPLLGSDYLSGDWSYTDKPHEFAVLCVHGFGSHRGGEKVQAVEAECAARGWTFASFDFRSHGQSSGTMLDLRASRLLEDLDSIYQFLSGHGVRRLYLFGSSMGGFASAWYAFRRPDIVPAVMLLAPAFHFLTLRWDRLSDEQKETFRHKGVMRFTNDWVDTELAYGLVEERHAFSLEELARDWHTPLLICHGMKDDVVKYQRSVQWVKQTTYQNIEMRLYALGDHRLTVFKRELASEACRFFAQHEAARLTE